MLDGTRHAKNKYTHIAHVIPATSAPIMFRNGTTEHNFAAGAGTISHLTYSKPTSSFLHIDSTD